MKSERGASWKMVGPALDEVVAKGASIHLEQMSHDQWWMGIEAGGKCFHLSCYLRDGRLHVNLSDQNEEEYTDWDGDSRERPFPGTEPREDTAI